MSVRRERTDWRLLASAIPPIVDTDPRYQQQTTADWWLFPGEEAEPQPVWNLDGVSWHNADPPPKRHQHWPQTVGLLDNMFDEVHRCVCGATRLNGPRSRGVWMDEREPRVALGWWRRMLQRGSASP